MDTARDKNTWELIEAEELWNLNSVNSDAYVCHGCSVQVFPASFDKDRNKKRPYFTLGPTKEHLRGCDVDGQPKTIKRAQGVSIGTPEGFPLPFPSKLTLTDERPTEKPAQQPSAGHLGNDIVGRSVGVGQTPKRHHGHTVRTIRPACRAFINFPHDRKTLPLAIPDVPGNTYESVFWRLAGKPKPFTNPIHLYYGIVRWKAKPVVTEEMCELMLNSGNWDPEAKDFRSPLKVCVNWSDWSQSRRDSLLREFDATREDAQEQSKQNKDIKGWLFFIGAQDATDASIFQVDNYRFICSLAAKVT